MGSPAGRCNPPGWVRWIQWVWLGVWFVTPVSADLQGEMDTLFGSLLNTNAPTAYQGQRRGVLSAGSLAMRSRIMNPSLATFTPPSWRGGCGGIDLYAGSFSFISADEFTQLLRSIAANASGYAFELAMNAMCPSCMQEMQRLSNIVRELSQNLTDSCQAAQWLVNNTVGAAVGQQQTESGLIAQGVGQVADALEALRPRDRVSPSKKANDAAPETVDQAIKGNVVWKLLKTRNASSWFRFGDDALLEAIMSVTGTFIVGDIPPGGEDHTRQAVEPTLTLKDVLYGARAGVPVTLWRCRDPERPHDADRCLLLQAENIDLKGMNQRVREVLLGTGNQPGLVAKWRLNVAASDPEKALMELTPLAGMIRNLAINSEGAALHLAEEAAPVIALELTVRVVDDLIRAVRLAAALQQQSLGPRMEAQLDRVSRDLAAERQAVQEARSRAGDLAQFYLNLLAALRDSRYLAEPSAVHRERKD